MAAGAGGDAPHNFTIDAGAFPAQPLEPGLFVVATPIGNLADITIRALSVLAAADVIACEDTRVTRTLTSRYGISTPMLAYHEHNAARMRPRLLVLMDARERVALVSDAGTPLISDPGLKLVRAALAAGHRVTPIPGASAVLAALTGAGLATDAVFFGGFLPARTSARRTRLTELAGVPATLVFFEAAPRLGEALADMAAVLDPRRGAVVARELTKKFETFRRAPLSELAREFAGAPPKGEIVILIAPPEGTRTGDAELDRLLGKALEALPVSKAAALVAEATGRSRRDVYARALALKGGEGDKAEQGAAASSEAEE